MPWVTFLPVAALCFGGVLLLTALIFRRALGRWLKGGPHEQPPVPCPHCGYDIRATLFFCPECGTELLWGELPGEQRDYDAKARRAERRTFNLR